MPDPVLLCDDALTIVAANGAAADLLGIPFERITGRNAAQLLEQSSGGHDAVCAGPDAAHLHWRSEWEVPGGQRRLLTVSGAPLRDRTTSASGWALSLRALEAGDAGPDFIGASAATQELLEFVSRIAASRATSILLLGESGTGKDLIARRLHSLSARAGAPFLAINCATLPEALLESELFGHERGAFTDARNSRKGLLESASGGTVLLDEIGDLPLALQPKLLRVLEERTFRPVGSARSIAVDLRIVGATNANLERAVAEGRFRSDLYYRLNVVQILVPALRERTGDIAALASYFLEHFNRVHSKNIYGIQPEAFRLLDTYAWPGNVRELRNVMERAVLVEKSASIAAASLSIPDGSSRHAGRRTHERTAFSTRFSLKSTERDLIAAALAEAGGNQSRAARLLGVGRFCLRYKIKKLGILSR